jgi:putative ABC transport system permease protein
MFFIKGRSAVKGLESEVRKAVRSVDPDVALRDVRMLDEVANGSWARTRFEAVLFGGFGAAALLLAATGIFAVLAFVVASRRREFGIRIALGADALRVLRYALGEGLLSPFIGILVGIGAAVGVTRVLRASLYEVSPLEPRVFGVTVLLLLGSAVLACLIPAWRATRADPLEAMRET